MTKQNHIGESIQNNLNSVLSWSTFGSDYSLRSGWTWCHKLCISGFGKFLPIFSADHLKLCQVDGGHLWTAIFRSLQIRLIGYTGCLTEWSMTGTLRVPLKALLHFLCCVLKISVQLEGEPSAQSAVPTALDQVFIKDIFAVFSLSATLTYSLFPDSEKQWRYDAIVSSGNEAWKRGLSQQIILFFSVWKSFRCFLEAFIWPLSQRTLIGGVSERGCPPISKHNLWSSSRVIIRVLVTSLTLICQ